MGWRENSNSFSLFKLRVLCLLLFFGRGWCVSGWLFGWLLCVRGFFELVVFALFFGVLSFVFFSSGVCERDVLIPFYIFNI